MLFVMGEQSDEKSISRTFGERSTSGGFIDFAVFEAKSTSGTESLIARYYRIDRQGPRFRFEN